MRIAIVKLSALGDIVHAMVVLQFIKKYNKEISIDWFVDSVYKDLLEFNPDINKVHTLNIKKAKHKFFLFAFFKILKETKKLEPYDLVIDLQGLIKSAILSRVIPSKVTLGFDRLSSREGLSGFFYNKKFNISYEKNVIDRNFELIKFALNLPNETKEIHKKNHFLFTPEKYDNLIFSNSKKNIVLIPGASHSYKRYPEEKFAKLSRLIDANYLIIWGNPNEKLMAKKIKSLSSKVTICDNLSLLELISIISQADLIIGSDTGPTHMAWALNVPSITLFGGTPGYRNTYVTKINKIIESNSSVNPLKINKNDFSIRNIKLEDVVKMAHYLLN